MAMNLGIGIEINPGDGVAKADAAEQALHRVEDRGIAAGKAMLEVAKGFQSFGQAVAQHQAALGRTADVHDRLTRAQQPLAQGFAKVAEQMAKEKAIAEQTTAVHERLTAQSNPAAAGFAKMADAIQREQKTLEQIRGPAKQYEQDLQTLNSLLAKGAITAKEHSTAMAGLKAPQGNVLNQAGNALAGAAIGAGVVGGARMLMNLDDEYTNARNSALKFTDAGHDVNDVLVEQRGIARELHVSIEDEMQAWDDANDSLDGLNVSRLEAIQYSKTLAQVSLLEHEGTNAAANAMKNLAVQMETGGDSSKIIRGVMKEFPDLAKVWTDSMHVSKEELIQLGKDGKLSFEDLEKATTQSTAAGDLFAQRTKTWSQSIAEIRDDAFRPLAEDLGHVVNLMKDMAAIEQGTSNVLADAAASADESLSDLDTTMQGATSDITQYADGWKLLNGMLNAAAASEKKATAAVREHAKAEMDLLSIWREQDAERAASARMRGADSMRNQAMPFTPGILNPAGKFSTLDVGAQNEFNKLADKGFGDQADMEKRYQGVIKWENGLEKAYRKGVEEDQRANDSMAKAAQEAAQKSREAWASGLGAIGGDFIKMARDGKESWKDMTVSMLEGLAKLTLEMAAMRLISGGGTGALGGQFLQGLLGGFAGGGSFTVGNSNSPWVLPRAANGANWTVGGTGSIDSKIAMFRVTPGESVHVRTPAQQAMQGGGVQQMGAMIAAIQQMAERPIVITDDLTDSMTGYRGARAAARVERRRGAAR